MVDENVPCETETKENLSFHETPTELLPKDEEIYRRLTFHGFPMKCKVQQEIKHLIQRKKIYREL